MAFDDYSHDQYLRRWTLSLGGGDGFGGTGTAGGELVLTTETEGLDLRMTFECRQTDGLTPNTAIIRVYNLSDDTAKSVVKEFNKVTLQAGYITGNYGIIFKGTIKQFKRGRESATDTYLDIFAADGDIAHNQAVINTTLPVGSTLDDVKMRVRCARAAPQGAPDREERAQPRGNRGTPSRRAARAAGSGWAQTPMFIAVIKRDRRDAFSGTSFRQKGELNVYR
jgi:hypothetical protein